MPNAHYKAVFQAILHVFESNKTVNALTVWEALQHDHAFQGGINEIIRLHGTVVESEPEAILTNYLPHCKILKHAFKTRIQEARKARLESTPIAELDSAILAEADRILAKRTQTNPFDGHERVPVFPKQLLFDVFKPYVAAYENKSEVPIASHFAVLSTAIGASLGRRVYIDSTTPIYPNFFSLIVGETGISRKSTALRQGEKLLAGSDSAVKIIRSLSTPEGFIQLFAPPDGYKLGESGAGLQEALAYSIEQSEPGVEGLRVLLSIDEFSYLLKKASKTVSDGLIQLLTESYDFPPYLDLPTRNNALRVDHPCVSLLGATTNAWLEESLTLSDVMGGFANRICYYYAKTDTVISNPLPPDPKLLKVVKYSVSQYRQKFPTPTAFTFSDESSEHLHKWYTQRRKSIQSNQNPTVKDAIARGDLHLRKAALLHAAITNQLGDTEIDITSYRIGEVFAAYQFNVVNHIYDKFQFTENARLEQRIIELLKQQPKRTARELNQQISWTDAQSVNRSINALVENGTIEGVTHGKAVRYHLLTEIDAAEFVANESDYKCEV